MGGPAHSVPPGVLVSFGGMAAGYAAAGAMAWGHYAIGGTTFGAHAHSDRHPNEVAKQFFEQLFGG